MTTLANLIPVITIDGPTASGKGTVAERVADALSFHYLDSGALYRLVALCAVRNQVAPDDAQTLAQVAANMPLAFRAGSVFLEGEDVTDTIRAEEVGKMASKIAPLPLVREALAALQLRFRRAPGLVADGRDMGTVVFPDACLKVFLTANARARAQRRYKQLKEKGFSANIDDLQKDLNERDARDANRAVSPLKPAEGAYFLDTSDLSAEKAVEQVLAWYAEKIQQKNLFDA